MTPFRERLLAAWQRSASLACVGLDPDSTKLPARFARAAEPMFEFNREVIDATHDLVCAYKPQIAFYSAVGAERELEKTIAHIRARAPQAIVILDAKRGDVGNTAAAYAREAFERYDADAVTVNAYLGGDSLAPFLADPARAALVLCRTSNPGARDLQDLRVDGQPLYRRVAERAARDWNAHHNLGLVVGATYPQELAELRQAHPELPFLVPGVGAQGGDVAAVVAAGVDPKGRGLFISSSRAIVFAGDADAIRAAAQALRDEINRARG
ncbi:MAG TPA: orotidine-5'-phosphate decarboxylase [Myxococcota bacterium]|nr:orotidine-5'-phosphate decarboxylase [Myxococcota bacterium]